MLCACIYVCFGVEFKGRVHYKIISSNPLYLHVNLNLGVLQLWTVIIIVVNSVSVFDERRVIHFATSLTSLPIRCFVDNIVVIIIHIIIIGVSR